VVALEELVLKCGCEAVKAEVTSHKSKAKDGGERIISTSAHTALCLAREQECGAAEHDSECDGVVVDVVSFPTNETTPYHDWHHLGALTERLDREGDVLKRLVLAGSSKNVAHTHRGEVHDGSAGS